MPMSSSPDTQTGGPRIFWDRGTLVVDRPVDATLLQAVRGVLWDPRIGVHRAPAYRYDRVRASLLALGWPLIDQVWPGLPRPVVPLAPIDLRPYQATAVGAWWAANRRGVMVLPTGAGKTRVALASLQRVGGRALVLVPTRVLLEQWCATLIQAGFRPDDVGRFGDGVREDRPITVSTFASARAHMPQLGNRADLLVVDECHHYGGDAGGEALEMCAATARLGLTATPPDPGPRLDRLAQLLGPIVFRTTIDTLAGTFLAPFDLVRLGLRLDPEERAEHDRLMALFRPICREFFAAQPDADWGQFAAAAMRSPDGQAALLALRQARELVSYCHPKRLAVGELLRRHHDRRVLIFTADNSAAYQVARDWLVRPLTCEVGRSERRATLEAFAAGGLRALVSARVLNEGVDVPAADVAILVGGSHGSREYVQRIGRVLRPGEGKRATIYELVIDDTHEARQLARGRSRLAAPEPAAVPPGW
jgi:superfamily II DNA or RNA helicase